MAAYLDHVSLTTFLEEKTLLKNKVAREIQHHARASTYQSCRFTTFTKLVGILLDGLDVESNFTTGGQDLLSGSGPHPAIFHPLKLDLHINSTSTGTCEINTIFVQLQRLQI